MRAVTPTSARSQHYGCSGTGTSTFEAFYNGASSPVKTVTKKKEKTPKPTPKNHPAFYGPNSQVLQLTDLCIQKSDSGCCYLLINFVNFINY